MEKYSKKNNNVPVDKRSHAAIKQMIDQKIKAVQEKKSFDQGFSATVSSAGSVLKLTTVPQDDTDSGRDGDALKLIKFELISTFAFADSVNVCRLLVFRWNQDDTTPPVIADVLQTVSPYSPINRDNLRAHKLDILEDHLFVVGATGPNIEKFNATKKMKSFISFQAASTSGTGHLYAVQISDSLAVTHPVLSYIFRVYFTDS